MKVMRKSTPVTRAIVWGFIRSGFQATAALMCVSSCRRYISSEDGIERALARSSSLRRLPSHRGVVPPGEPARPFPPTPSRQRNAYRGDRTRTCNPGFGGLGGAVRSRANRGGKPLSDSFRCAEIRSGRCQIRYQVAASARGVTDAFSERFAVGQGQLADVFDDLDKLVDAVAVPPRELNECPCLCADKASLGCSRDSDPAAAAEVEESFVAELA